MISQEETFTLDKSTWTHDDLEVMGWHDANIYGLTFENSENNWSSDFLLDIDYIFQWVNPVPPSEYFSFWVAPCTLIFKQTFDLKIDFSTGGGVLDTMEIADLYLKSKVEQEKNLFMYEWVIELQQGVIRLKSYGYEQIVRQYPSHVQTQVLSLDERGGICFSRQPCSLL